MYIDAVIVQGENRTFSSSIKVLDENETDFIPMDLDDYSIEFRVMGSPTADGEVLLSKIITQNTDRATIGRITDAANGQFDFSITRDDTISLGLGKHPIQLRLLNAETGELVYTVTEGGLNGEFNSITIVQV